MQWLEKQANKQGFRTGWAVRREEKRLITKFLINGHSCDRCLRKQHGHKKFLGEKWKLGWHCPRKRKRPKRNICERYL